jgi:hypothetical protein
VHSTAKSSQISPPGNKQSKPTSTITGPNFQGKKIRSLGCRESSKIKPYVSIRQEQENYKNLESETTGQPTGKQQMHNLKTVTKSQKSRKLRKLRYKGDVSDYLVNFRDLNQTVASAGQAFPDQVKVHLPDNIVNMMYLLGPILEDDDVFLQVVELAGKRVDEMKRRAKARNIGEAKPQETTIEKRKEKVINKNKDNRKEKKNEETYKNNKKDQKIKNPKRKNIPQQKRP